MKSNAAHTRFPGRRTGPRATCSGMDAWRLLGGVGESATVGAPPTIGNAVVGALSYLGVRHIEIPMTPEKVRNILRKKGVAE
jgi:hypothetical protein